MQYENASMIIMTIMYNENRSNGSDNNNDNNSE